ncbi:MAG: T9SS type A sorting domain-containing protein, partial [Bacteroidales bacterium]
LIGGDSVTVVCKNLTNFFSCGAFSTYLWNGTITDSVMVVLPQNLSLGYASIDVNVMDSNGCAGADTLIIYVDDCYSIHDTEPGFAISVSPNPSSSGIFYAELSSAAQLRIFNIKGQVIDGHVIKSDLHGLFTIDLSSFPDGAFLLKVNVDKGFKTKWLIKGAF